VKQPLPAVVKKSAPTPAATPKTAPPVAVKHLATSLPKEGEERFVTIDTPLYRAVFSTKGGTLTSFRLKQYRANLKKDSELVELVNIQERMKAPLGISFVNSSLNLPEDLFYKTTSERLELTNKGGEARLIFQSIVPGKVQVEKIYTFHADSYAVNLEVKLRNLLAEPLEETAALTWYEYVDASTIKDDYGHTGPIVYLKGDVKRPKVKDISEEKVYGPDVLWGGFETKYFLAAAIPPVPSLARLHVNKGATENEIVIKLVGGKRWFPVRRGEFSLSPLPGTQGVQVAEGRGGKFRRCHRFWFMAEVARHAPPHRSEFLQCLHQQLRDLNHSPHAAHQDPLLALGQ